MISTLNSTHSPRDTAWIVAKFGGTSVSTLDRWQAIRDIVTGHLAKGHPTLVVCSALAGVTDQLEALSRALGQGEDPSRRLLALRKRHAEMAQVLGVDAERTLGETLARLETMARELSGRAEVSARAHAELMAHGELLSTRLGAAFLAGQGLPAVFRDARDLLRAAPPPSGCSTAHRYLSATCEAGARDPEMAQALQAAGRLVVTQGFIARDAAGDTVLLGRGGSDTSAAYLASKLAAARLEIWTDVPGMFTVNPNAIPSARLLPRLTYAEARVLAALGARVLHPRCLRVLEPQGIPLRVGWTERPRCGGTLVNGQPTSQGLKAIASRRKLCLLSMRRRPEWQPIGFMADVAACFRRQGLSMDLVASSPSEIRATIDLGAFPDALARMDALMRELSAVCKAEIEREVASVSLIGHRLLDSVERFGMASRLLRGQDVRLVSHAADESSVSYVLPSRSLAELESKLHAILLETGPRPSELGQTYAELTRSTPKPPPSVTAA